MSLKVRPPLSDESALVPITAIACLNGIFIAGAGSSVRFIDDTYHTLAESKVFDSQIIHGVAINNESALNDEVALVIWGSRKVRLARVKTSHGRPDISLGPVIETSDWILDARFDTLEEDWRRTNSGVGSIRAALITAHNSLIELNSGSLHDFQRYAVPDGSQPSLTELTAASRCILYSANLTWLSKTRILVAAGTVFGEIIVWSCDTSKRKDGENVEASTHNVFTGHEGSVFGVRISSPLTLSPGRAPQLLLASCSDDRTIRIWQIAGVEVSGNSIAPQQMVDKSQDRETGFGARPELLPRGLLANNGQVAWSWAHASRIWNLHFLQPRSLREIAKPTWTLVSIGEDATCRLWTLSSDEGGQFTLRHIRSSEHHTGKNIWSSAVMHGTNGGADVITGGADGSIILHHLLDTGTSRGYENAYEDWTINNVSETMNIHTSCEKKLSSREVELKDRNVSVDYDEEATKSSFSESEDQDMRWVRFPLERNDMFREYAFIRPNAFMTMTKSGTLLLAASEVRNPWSHADDVAIEKTLVKWLRVMDFEELRNDSTLSKPCTSHPLFCAFLGGRSGVVYYYDANWDLTSEVTKVDGKISGLFLDLVQFGAGDSRTAFKVLSLTVTTGGGRYLHNFLSKSYECHRSYLESSHSKLILPPGFVVTCIKHIYIDMQHEVLFIGSRNAGIAIYSIRRLREVRDPEVVQPSIESSSERLPTLVLADVHGREAVTSIFWLSDIISSTKTKQRCNSGHLFSTGRDGTYTVHYLTIDFDSVDALLIHKVTLPFGPYIEGLDIDPQTNHLHLWGFRNKRFVLWDETAAEHVMDVECGGAHRNWAFYPSERGWGGIFVWTRANVCNIYRQKHPQHRTIQSGGHGREIKALAVAPVSVGAGDKEKFLIATGAEDTDVRIFEYDSTGLITPMHKGVVRCLRVLRKHNTGIQHLQWSDDGKYLFSSGGCEELFVWRVRSAPIVGIAVVCESKLPFQSKIPDLRITSFDVRSHSEPQAVKCEPANAVVPFLVACSYSDSTVRVYKYQSGDSSTAWQFLYAGAYGPNHTCLTQCMFLPGRSTILTAGGDGYIAFWDFASSSPTRSTLQLPSGVSPQEALGAYGSTHVIHQNSVKALTFLRLNEKKTLLLTGGDDNALGITFIKDMISMKETTVELRDAGVSPTDHEEQSISLSTLLIPRAHAAAVTAVAAVDVTHSNTVTKGYPERTVRNLYVVTSGNDQRIKTWELSIDLDAPGTEGVRVKKLANTSTSVADLADIAVLKSFADKQAHLREDRGTDQDEPESRADLRVVACGVGMEVWKLL